MFSSCLKLLWSDNFDHYLPELLLDWYNGSIGIEEYNRVEENNNRVILIQQSCSLKIHSMRLVDFIGITKIPSKSGCLPPIFMTHIVDQVHKSL